jgi:sugar phosphate isomerase/epimerase
VSEYTTKPWSFEQDVRAYAELGVAAIEVVETKLDVQRLEEQFAMIAESGLRVSSVQAGVHGLFPTKLVPEPQAYRERARALRASIEKLAPYLPPGTPFVTITGAPPEGNVDGVLRIAWEEYAELARVADAHGMRLAFEPLNPSLMNIDTAVWSLGDAIGLVDAVNASAFGLCVDTWNIWQSPALDEVLAQAGDRIFLVQISDWRAPRALYDRVIPGAGEIPFEPFFLAVERAGYRGPYVLEIFSDESLPDSLWRRDLREVIRISKVRFELLASASATR